MANEFIHIDPGAILTKAEFELITGHQFNSQATGDILYASTSTQLSRLGIGSNTNVLEITGGVPAWVASSGTGSVARVTSPTFVTPALGTPASGVMTNVSGTAASLTAGAATALATARTIGGTSFDGTANIAITTNANLTGVVTSSGNATSIADKALAIAKLADGTDGELITWNASGVIAAVAAGSADEVLTSNGAGAAPTFQAASGGGGGGGAGAAKAWAVVAADGTLESPSFNMTSVAKSATGRYVYTFDTDFSDADYTGSPAFRAGYGSAALQEGTQDVGSVALRFWDACGTLADADHSCVFHGEQ